jgi:hypothetical protein
MARFFRLSLLLAVAGIMATAAVADVPDAVFSDVPDKLTIFPAFQAYPGVSNWNEMTIKSNLGVPVAGAQIDIIFDEADLFCWCNGQAQPTITANANGSGYAYFEIYGGGCADISRTAGGEYPARILADGILMRRVQVNSPDVVDEFGVLATDGWAPGGTCQVKGNDASWHTPGFINNLVEPCTKVDQTKAITDPVDGTDASILTPFIIANSNCTQAP